MRSQMSLGTRLTLLMAGMVTISVCGLRPVFGQSLQQTAKTLVIHEIVGEDTVEVGDVETYRAKTNVTRDVEFRWTSNGATSLGNPIVHRFEYPGTYEIVVTARNPVSTARDTFTITVLEAGSMMAASTGVESPAEASTDVSDESDPDEPGASSGEVATPDASVTAASSVQRAESGFTIGAGGPVNQGGQGYTWVIATYFKRPSAVALANSYRASGYKASVITDKSGQGTQVYRVILGEFGTEQSALRAKQHLVRAGHRHPILLELGSRG